VLKIIFQICQECQDIVEELATAQEKEETAHSVRDGDVGAQAILGSFAFSQKRRNGGKSVCY
jgi:hypothetical protein